MWLLGISHSTGAAWSSSDLWEIRCAIHIYIYICLYGMHHLRVRAFVLLLSSCHLPSQKQSRSGKTELLLKYAFFDMVHVSTSKRSPGTVRVGGCTFEL